MARPDPLVWLTVFFCLTPSLMNLIGVDFGSKIYFLDYTSLSQLPYLAQENRMVEFLNGRFIQVMLVTFSVPIAFLTVILAFVDYSIKRDISTPIVGVALFCAGLLDIFHILTATGLVGLEGDQRVISEFTWLISRIFHASILILGTGVFLLFFDPKKNEAETLSEENFVFYTSLIFVLISILTINILLSLRRVPELYYPQFFVTRPFDTIPIFLYLFLGIFLFPSFYKKYPSAFSRTLILSIIPAIFSQIHMALSSSLLQDNHFNIAHFLQIATYFIPFLGLSLNYLQTHRNEQEMIKVLDNEIRVRAVAEELISGIYNSSVNGIMAFRSLGPQWKDQLHFSLLTYNTSSEQILEPKNPLKKGMLLADIFDGVITSDIVASVNKLVEKEKAIYQEIFIPRVQKWINLTLVKLGEGFVLTLTDITERRQTERQLLMSEKLALTGRFARTIAHEVRNPLTNITLSVGQLQTEPAFIDPSLDLYFDIIRRNCERINQLITELLNSTRPDEFNFQWYSVEDLIDETLSLADDRIQLKEIMLFKRFSHQQSTFLIDPVKLKIALLNIIINAIEAMSSATGILEVETSGSEKELHIKIKDNGVGIPDSNLGQLFEPFFTGKIKGTGLGLTSTQNIIHNHNGTIQVNSTVGKGSEFVISLTYTG